MINFSVLVPVYNESANIPKLVTEIFLSLEKYKNFELIIINDGSEDNSAEIINKLGKNYPITLINHESNLGQSFSIWNGVKKSKYKTIVTLDGDGQNNPNDIPKLLNVFFEDEKLFLIGGIRKKRKDNIIKIISSKLANKIRSYILEDDCIDTGCSLKVFDKKIFLSFSYFNGIHRFLPALFKGYGYQTRFIEVDHRIRIYGKSKYGTFDRLLKGIKDLIKVKHMIKENKKL